MQVFRVIGSIHQTNRWENHSTITLLLQKIFRQQRKISRRWDLQSFFLMINNISQVRAIIWQVIGDLTIMCTHNCSMLRSIWWVTILCTILENLYFLDLIQISNLLTLPSNQTTMIVTMIASKSLWENFNDLKTWKKELRNNGRKEFEKLYCMKVNISRMWKMSKNWSNTLRDISDQRNI